ncbi:MAG: T9SS type A sorting domain-containing protein, partial [Saprospiraceae bacterium]
DDGDATTIDDVLNSNCECLGTSIFDCPTLSANTGAPCDDGNPVTYDDVLDANCNCVGIPFDCPIYLADIGTSCDDGNPVTYNDVLDANCNCVGTPFDCPIYLADIGATCDDGNPTTMGDALNENCNCEGTSIFDCPALSQNFGDSCNDGNPNTFDDVITENCECLGNETPYDCPLLSANIGDPCDDGNPISFNDIINNNCECKGTITDYECPLLGLNYGDACDDNDPETSNDVITENCTCEGTSSTATITVEIPVAASNDDAEEKPSGSVSLTSSDLELAVDGSNIMKIGIRFRNPEIPVGAVITNAYVQFQTDETKNLDPVSISIFGEAHDNSPVFVKAGFNISNRAKTAMVIDWSNIPAWNVKGERAEAQQTTNIATIIQEIINRPGYNYNNAITLLMEGSGRRVAESFDGDVLGAPALVITYSFDCDDDDNDGICNQQDDCPQSPNNPGTPCNDGNSDTVNDVIDSNCECHGSEPVGAACAKIITSWDDGEEKADGAVKLSSSDLELVQESSLQTVGMRFQDMLIPPGATITNAYLQFTVDETANLNPCELIIHGQADGNPSQFAKIDYNISSRPKTNEFVIWTPEDWITKDVAGDAQRTLNLSPVIQEIVNRSDYNAGNPIVLILEGTGRRVAKSFESGAASSPELCVEFDLQNNNTSDKAEEHSLLEEGSINLASDLKVYPNPASDYLNLVFNSSDKDEITTIQVIDINGKVLLEKSQEIIAGTKTLSIEPLNLPNGAYYLRLNMQQRVLMGQFVIVR